MDGVEKAKFTKRIGYFASQGENCYFSISHFNTEPYLISFGNNVAVATGVKFLTHDVTSFLFRNMQPEVDWRVRTGTITIGDNVFIGANAVILYDVKIGNSVIVGAGPVVNKDVPDNVIVEGVPAKVIGCFDDYREKMRKLT